MKFSGYMLAKLAAAVTFIVLFLSVYFGIYGVLVVEPNSGGLLTNIICGCIALVTAALVSGTLYKHEFVPRAAWRSVRMRNRKLGIEIGHYR